MGKLQGKVAVVTGASKGIGAGIARSLAAEGASVVVNYASSREGAEFVVKEIKHKGGEAIAVQGDVARADDVKRLFRETKRAFGKVDVLVNNAGVYRLEPLEAVTEDEFHRHFNTNVLGPVLATREALRLFGPEGGSVINIGSVVSEGHVPGATVYAATKAALDAVTRTLSAELATRRIRVNTIAPGGTVTEGFAATGVAGTDVEKQLVARTALGRMGQPEDIARVAVFLASADSAWLTGERITASGGFR